MGLYVKVVDISQKSIAEVTYCNVDEQIDYAAAIQSRIQRVIADIQTIGGHLIQLQPIGSEYCLISYQN